MAKHMKGLLAVRLSAHEDLVKLKKEAYNVESGGSINREVGEF